METTTLCNASCWFCPQKKAKRHPVFMRESIWKKIVDETRGLALVYRPFLLNEPFLDDNLINIIKYIKQDPSARVEVNTNGEALSPKKADLAIEAGLDAIIFSVDGIKRATLQSARGLDYDTVYHNVAYFIRAARASRRDIHTTVRMIRLPNSESEHADYRNYWEAIGPTTVSFSRLYRYPWEGQSASLNLPCIKIVNEMFFYVNGYATLCCWDTMGRQIVGNVSTQSVLQIWNGDPFCIEGTD